MECVALTHWLTDNPSLTLERRCLRKREVSRAFADLHLSEGKKKVPKRKKNFLFLVFKMAQELQRKKSPTWEGKPSAL